MSYNIFYIPYVLTIKPVWLCTGMADQAKMYSGLTVLLHENETYHAILRTLSEKEGQGFNELFEEASDLRLRLHPEMGELSKGTYYDCINSLLEISAASRERDPRHSQRWLYRLEPSLGEELKRLYRDVEAPSYYTSVDSAELYLRNLPPSQAANYIVQYAVKNLVEAYTYCVENPSLADYRMGLMLSSLHILGVGLAEISHESDAHKEYLEGLADLKRLGVQVKF